MIRINLLPPEIYAAKAQRQFKAIGVVAGLLVAAAMIGYYFWRLQTANRLEAQLDQAKQELSKYQAIANQVGELEAKRSQLTSRRNVITQLLTGTLIYPKFFEDFMALLPPDIWIGNLQTSLDGAGNMAVSMSCQSLSSFAIADWLTNLLGSPLCSNVKLGAISSTDDGGDGRGAIHSFAMSFGYHRRD